MPTKEIEILIDDREQEPYEFGVAEHATTRTVRLPAGDYSLAGWSGGGLCAGVSVERKTFDDYVATIVNHRHRFYEELSKLESYRYSGVVVEGTWERLVSGPWKTKTHANTLIGITQSIIHAWHIPVIFAGDRPHARLYVLEFLRRAADWLGDPGKSKT